MTETTEKAASVSSTGGEMISIIHNILSDLGEGPKSGEILFAETAEDKEGNTGIEVSMVASCPFICEVITILAKTLVEKYGKDAAKELAIFYVGNAFEDNTNDG